MEDSPYRPPSADLTPSGGAVPGDVTLRTVQELAGTKPWVQLIAILGFIGIGFMLLGAVGMFIGGAITGLTDTGGVVVGPVMFAFAGLYVILALVYLYPTVKLWGYGSAIGRLKASQDRSQLVEALARQRQFWKFAGILMIIGFVLGFAVTVARIVMAMSAASGVGSELAGLFC